MCVSRVRFLICVLSASAVSQPTVGGNVPFVEVAVAPEAPVELARAIVDLDSARFVLQNSAADAGARAFDAALRAAAPRIDAVAKQAVRAPVGVGGRFAVPGSSFLARGTSSVRSGGEVIDVEVPAEKPVDVSSVVDALKASESLRASRSVLGSDRLRANFDSLTAFVVEHARAVAESLPSGDAELASSFFDASAGAAPSAAVISDFVVRGGIGEEIAGAKHLALAAALLRRENGMLRTALRREVAAAGAASASFLGVSSESSGGGAGQFAINFVPPAEDVQDTLAQLDDLMAAERAKQVFANKAFAGEKQQALDAENISLRQFSQASFA